MYSHGIQDEVFMPTLFLLHEFILLHSLQCNILSSKYFLNSEATIPYPHSNASTVGNTAPGEETDGDFDFETLALINIIFIVCRCSS